jgi:hypothetical protein
VPDSVLELYRVADVHVEKGLDPGLTVLVSVGRETRPGEPFPSEDLARVGTALGLEVGRREDHVFCGLEGCLLAEGTDNVLAFLETPEIRDGHCFFRVVVERRDVFEQAGIPMEQLDRRVRSYELAPDGEGGWELVRVTEEGT